MAKLWLVRDTSPFPRAANLDAEGQWPGAMVGLRSLAAVGVPPSSAPPGWVAANVPVTGNWVAIPIGFVRNTQEQTLLQLKPIGPYNVDPQRAAALQANLADQLRRLQ